MTGLRRQPVSRPKVLLGGLIAIGVLAAVVAGAEWLRPGSGNFGVITPELDADPRIEVDCPEEPAREGRRPRAARTRAVEDVTSTMLYDCPTTWDGRNVRYIGEAVGAVLRRGDMAWLQVNDDVYAGELGPLPLHRELRGGNAGVGVLTTAEQALRLGHIGGAGQRGDVVEVIGTYHRVDETTREVAVIRAETLRVIGPGGTVDRHVDGARLVVAALLGATAAGLLVLQWVVRRRRFR